VTRSRVRWFIDEVRKAGSNAGRLREQAGYRKYENLLDALFRRTGYAPRDIRRLSHNKVRGLFDDD
jgi:hypothetical protein